MKNSIRFLSLIFLLSFTVFSCTKEADQPETVTATSDENTELIDLGVLDRSEGYNLSWNASNGINVQYQVINNANNQVLFTKYWYSFVSGSHYYTAPDGLCVRAVLRATRNYPGPGQENMNWKWKRTNCPLISGVYAVTAPYGTPWGSIPQYIMAANSCPCQ